MQAITWDKAELQASISRKLALLRQHRDEDKGLSLEQRLALAEDRDAFETARVNADARRRALPVGTIEQAPGPHRPGGIVVKRGHAALAGPNTASDFFMSRFDDVGMASGRGGPGDDDAPIERTAPSDSFAAEPVFGRSPAAKPDKKTITDSHASEFSTGGARPSEPFVPHAVRYRKSVEGSAAAAAGSVTATFTAGPGKKAGVSLPVGSTQFESAAPRAQADLTGDGAQTGRPLGALPSLDEAGGADERVIDEDYTEVPADQVRARSPDLYQDEDRPLSNPEEIERQRLILQTMRQSSPLWVVLDRATVLNCLSGHPQGLTMVQMATRLLGAAASERDTRRLSALMKREEKRGTVATSGRGKPIVITDAGRESLGSLDVTVASQQAAARRQRRLEGQQRRLLANGAELHGENAKPATKAKKETKKVPHQPQKADVQKAINIPVRVVKNGKVLDAKDFRPKPHGLHKTPKKPKGPQ